MAKEFELIPYEKAKPGDLIDTESSLNGVGETVTRYLVGVRLGDLKPGTVYVTCSPHKRWTYMSGTVQREATDGEAEKVVFIYKDTYKPPKKAKKDAAK